MSTGRRTLVLVSLVAVVAAPAVLLRVLCVGRACEERGPVTTPAPFCGLPDDARRPLIAGYHDGRSPGVLVATGDTPVAGTSAGIGPIPWPSASPTDAGRVPLVFSGPGVRSGSLPEATRLDAVAPTVAALLGFEVPHPEVRSGRALDEVVAGPPAPLVVEVVWKGVGTRDLEARPDAWPTLRGLLEEGAGTMDAEVGSIPVDPAAVLTTLGTGGLPRQHGITGTLVRNDQGRVVRAWAKRAPFTVIAALGDDLDESLGQRPLIGMVGTDVADRGIIGGNWYVDVDRDDVRVAKGPRAQAGAAAGLLGTGYGRDDVPDLLAVVMDGSVRSMDRALEELLGHVAAVSGVAVVVTATGSASPPPDAVEASRVREDAADALPVDPIDEVAAGGFFLDQEALADAGMATADVTQGLANLRGPGGDRYFVDVFSGTAVTLARYC